MPKQPKLPEQFKLTAAQERVHGSPLPRQFFKGLSRDTKALLTAGRKRRERA